MPDIRQRNVGTMTYVANQNVKLELPRQHMDRRIGLALSGVMTVAGGTTDGTLVQDGILNIIRRIELKANGSDTVKSVSAKMLYFKAQLEDSSPDVLVQPAVTVGANSCKFQIYLDFLLKRTGYDSQALLDSRRLTGFDLFVTFGSEANVITGGDRTETLVATIDVFVEEMVGVTGEMHANIETLYDQDLTGAAANAKREFKLTRGDLYKNLAILVTDNSLRDNDLVNQVRVVADGTQFLVDMAWESLQNDNVRFYGVERVSGSAPITGFAIVEFDKTHLMDSLVDSFNLSDFKLEFDHNAPTGTAGIQVQTQALRINPKAVKSDAKA